jgi:DNA polymerase-3 subunit delta
MLIFLYGPDNFRSRKKLNEIIGRFEEDGKNELNLEIFDGEDLEFNSFKNALTTVSFFSSKRLIIVKNLLTKGSAKLLEEFNEYSSKLDSKDAIVVFWEEKDPDKRTKLFKFFKKTGKSQEFKLLENYQITDWIKKELEKNFEKIRPGLSDTVETKPCLISSKAQKKIAAFVGSNLWQMKNEINKLAFYKLGTIESDDIDALVASSITSNVFDIVDALGNKNQKDALRFLHEQLEKGENAIYLFTMIVYQFRNLIKIKSLIKPISSVNEFADTRCQNSGYLNSSSIAKETGLHPYVTQKTIVQTKKFSLTELKENYQELLNLDLLIKTGKIEPVAALDLLIVQMTS